MLDTCMSEARLLCYLPHLACKEMTRPLPAGIQRTAMPQRGSSWTLRADPGVHTAMIPEAGSKLPS